MRWRTLRAPLSSWLHSAARYGQTSSLISSSRPRSAALCTICRSCRRAISARSSCESGRKVVMQSMRPRSSAGNACRRIRFVRSCALPGVKPTPFFTDSPLPRLEVMTIMVFLKSTVRPRESVRMPSSSICSSSPVTSRCAFSSSSSSTTLYGLRRTFSVSVPPSS